jgi:hypothetical protein
MADTVSSLTIADTSGVKFTTKLTNFSDGTGETDVKKVDASETTYEANYRRNRTSGIHCRRNRWQEKLCH